MNFDGISKTLNGVIFWTEDHCVPFSEAQTQYGESLRNAGLFLNPTYHRNGS